MGATQRVVGAGFGDPSSWGVAVVAPGSGTARLLRRRAGGGTDWPSSCSWTPDTTRTIVALCAAQRWRWPGFCTSTMRRPSAKR